MNSRRDFFKSTCIVTGYLITVPALISFLESCASVKFISVTETEGMLTLKKSEMLKRTFVVVKTQTLAYPVYLAKIVSKNSTGENYSALLMQCTHKQCEVKPAGSALICPCHGSEFSAQGKVLKEPASVDLHKFSVTSDADNIYIRIK